MNIEILEKLTRKALRGESVESKSILKNGVITPAEHRSIESLSSQIAANIRVVSGSSMTSGTVALILPIENRWA